MAQETSRTFLGFLFCVPGGLMTIVTRLSEPKIVKIVSKKWETQRNKRHLPRVLVAAVVAFALVVGRFFWLPRLLWLSTAAWVEYHYLLFWDFPKVTLPTARRWKPWH